MRSAFVLPGGPSVEQLEQAVLAEEAGWDGVFVWEAGYGVDAWALLAAIAARTSRVRLGTILTPLPWRRPWRLASQVATVDQISGGRAMVAVGLGATDDAMLQAGEETDRKERAATMDEGIDVMRALWTGDGTYRGERFTVDCPQWLRDAARPVQDRIPVWVAAAWPRPKSMRRVLRCDGVLPEWHLGGRDSTPDDVRAMLAWLTARGARADLDVVSEGETAADDPAAASERVRPWAEAGCTWWLETRWEMPPGDEERMRRVRDRLAAGPPRP